MRQPDIAAQPSIDGRTQKGRRRAAQPAKIAKLTVGVACAACASQAIDPEETGARQTQWSVRRARGGADIRQGLLREHQIAGLDQHAQMCGQRHDSNEHVARCLCSDQEIASALSGRKQIAVRDQHTNGRDPDKRDELIVISVSRHISRRGFRGPTLPEQDPRKRCLRTRALGSDQSTSDNCRTTERFPRGQLCRIGPGRRLPYPCGSGQRLILRLVRVRGRFTEDDVCITSPAALEHQSP